MPQHGDPALIAGPGLDLPRQDAAHAAQPHVAERVDAGLLHDLRPELGHLRALRHDEDAEGAPARMPSLYALADFVNRERDFGHQDDVRPAGEAPHGGDPTGVAPHDFDDHDPV